MAVGAIPPLFYVPLLQPKYMAKEDEKKVLNALRQDSLTIDELAIKTGLQADDLMIILTGLEIADYIIQTEGGNYSAI